MMSRNCENMLSCTKLTTVGKIYSPSQKFKVNMFSNLLAPVFVKHLGSGSNSPGSQRNDSTFKIILHDFSPSGLCGNMLHFYHSHSYFLKTKVTQDSKARTSVLFKKIILNLKPFSLGDMKEAQKALLRGFQRVVHS